MGMAHDSLSGKDLIEELRGCVDDILSDFEKKYGKNYTKTRTALHGVFDLAINAHAHANNAEELQAKNEKLIELVSNLQNSLAAKDAVVEKAQDYISALEQQIKETPEPLQLGDGCVILPVEPDEDILWRMSGRPNGPSFPEMKKVYLQVIKAAQEP